MCLEPFLSNPKHLGYLDTNNVWVCVAQKLGSDPSMETKKPFFSNGYTTIVMVITIYNTISRTTFFHSFFFLKMSFFFILTHSVISIVDRTIVTGIGIACFNFFGQGKVSSLALTILLPRHFSLGGRFYDSNEKAKSYILLCFGIIPARHCSIYENALIKFSDRIVALWVSFFFQGDIPRLVIMLLTSRILMNLCRIVSYGDGTDGLQ